MDPQHITALVGYLQHQRLIQDFVIVATAAIYDYLLTLHLEVKFIWFSRWSYTKIVFLVIRYMNFLCSFILVYAQTVPDISVESCPRLVHAQSWLIVLLVYCAELVLAVRTWALWNRNKAIGVVLLSSILASFIIECVWLSELTASFQYSPPPYSGFRGCLIAQVAPGLWKQYVALTGLELFVLFLVMTSAFRSYRHGNWNRLTRVIHNDGILFYVYLLCLTAANIATTTLLPRDMMTLLCLSETCFYSVFTTRVVLNIRQQSYQGIEIELHTECFQSPSLAIPFQAISNDHSRSITAATSSHTNYSKFRSSGDGDTNGSHRAS